MYCTCACFRALAGSERVSGRVCVCVWTEWIKPIDLWQGSCFRLLCTRVILMFFRHSLRPQSVSESSCFSPLLYPSACPRTPTAVCQSAWHNTVCLITPPFILPPLKPPPPPPHPAWAQTSLVLLCIYSFISWTLIKARPEGQGPKKALHTHKHREVTRQHIIFKTSQQICSDSPASTRNSVLEKPKIFDKLPYQKEVHRNIYIKKDY